MMRFLICRLMGWRCEGIETANSKYTGLLRGGIWKRIKISFDIKVPGFGPACRFRVLLIIYLFVLIMNESSNRIPWCGVDYFVNAFHFLGFFFHFISLYGS